MAETFGFASRILGKAGVELKYHRMSRSSDQSFWGHGIPSVLAALSEQQADDSPTSKAHAHLFGGGGLGWWWHTPEDTLDKIDPAFFKRDAAFLHRGHLGQHALCGFDRARQAADDDAVEDDVLGGEDLAGCGGLAAAEFVQWYGLR